MLINCTFGASCSSNANGSSNAHDLTSEQPTINVIQEVLPIAVVIVFVNSLVFYLFSKRKRLRTPANFFLLSLAVCDFLTGFVSIPLFLIVVTRVVKLPTSLHLGFFTVIFNNTMAIAAAYHILVITLERYFAITRPFRHRQMTKKAALKIICLVWLIASLFSFIPYAWFTEMIKNYIMFQKIQFGYVIFCLLFVFLIPCVLIVMSQIVMFKAIATRGSNGINAQKAVRKARNEKKCLIIFAAMAIIYVVCWLPWFVLTLFFSLWFPLSKQMYSVLDDLSQAFVIFRYVTSVVNPLLYTFFKRDFLEAFKLFILKRKQTAYCPHSMVRATDSSLGFHPQQKKLIARESDENLEETQWITVL